MSHGMRFASLAGKVVAGIVVAVELAAFSG